MRTNRIRLTESQLHNVIKESVKQVMNEMRAAQYYNQLSPQKQQEIDNMLQYERQRGNNISFADWMSSYFGMNFDDSTGSTQKSGGVSGRYGYGTNTRDDNASRW